jgi:outer membrane receptor protein involved in Fe transport
MINFRHLFVLWLVFCLFSSLAIGNDDVAEPRADVTLLVFENGKPIADLTVLVDDQLGTTSDAGIWSDTITPGLYTLQVLDGETVLAKIRLELADSEIIQIIVTLRGEERLAYVSIESSKGVVAQASASDAPLSAVGEGLLYGQVRSSEDGRPIERARIFVSGTSVEALTDEEGRFEVTLASGEYVVSVLHGEYATRTIEGIIIAQDGRFELDLQLPPSGLELAEFVVLVPFIGGSISAVLDERLRSASVSEVLGAEQMSRAGDSDAGSALARVTGLTLVGGEFIFVRGLGERYSSTLLNRASVPSPDPSRKVVPMSLFPTGVIESIRVQKSYSPDMPGEFGGGSVDIRTNSIPAENFFTVSLSGGYLQGTTGRDGLTYQGGSRDWLGRDDGTRALPGIVADAVAGDVPLIEATIFNPVGFSADELEALGDSFSVIYDINLAENQPNQGLSLDGGMRGEWGDWSAGFLGAAAWSQDWSNRQETRRQFNIGEGELRLRDEYELDRTEHKVEGSLFLTAGLSFKDTHEISLTSMLLRQTLDDVRQQVGFDQDTGGIVQVSTLEYEERDLLSHQMKGQHTFPFLADLNFSWDVSNSRARRLSPDTRIYLFEEDARSPTGLVFSRRTDNNFRNYGDLEDEVFEWGADLELPFSVGRADITLSAGWRKLDRDRDSDLRRFKFDGIQRFPLDLRFADSLEDIINPDNINPNGLVIRESTRATDNSFALLDIEAVYGMLDVLLWERVRINGGVRQEDWRQSAITFDLFDPDGDPIEASLAAKDYLPSASMTLYLSERQQVIASYGETLIRPDLRELSPAEFTDPVLDAPVIGNPNLQPSRLVHYDLRYDFSPTPTELVSIGVFYKKIDQPIELIILPSEALLVTFANADGAENYGVEFELRKRLGFLNRWLFESSLWDRIEMAGNASWIESQIDISEQGILTSNSRALQGQSPYVLNGQISYIHSEDGPEASLLYNVAGKRISEVGVLGQPDKYAQPFAQLDFTLSWPMGERASFKFKAQNLLDSTFKITQGTEVSQIYTKGRKFSVGLDIRF